MKKFMEEFKAFALRGNVMDMAVGVIIGGAFSGIVTSLTDNFINPILNVLTDGKLRFSPMCQSFLLYYILHTHYSAVSIPFLAPAPATWMTIPDKKFPPDHPAQTAGFP